MRAGPNCTRALRWTWLLFAAASCHSSSTIDAGAPPPKPAPTPSGFERIDDALAMGTSKFASAGDVDGRTDAVFAAYFKRTRTMTPEQARAFAASDDPLMVEYRAASKSLTGDHSHPGAFLARLGRLFGPPLSTQYTLKHRATGEVVTAYSGPSGPAYGAGISADAATVRAVIRELDAMVWAAKPVDCSFVLEGDVGPYVTGFRDGGAFLDELDAKALFDFYEPQLASAGNALDRASTATLLLSAVAELDPPLEPSLKPRAEAALTAALDALDKLGPDEAEDKREHAETLGLATAKLKLGDAKTKARLKKLQ